jgi:hypothetical protein
VARIRNKVVSFIINKVFWRHFFLKKTVKNK